MYLLAALVHLAAEIVVAANVRELIADTNADVAQRGQTSSVVDQVEALTTPLIMGGLVLGLLLVAGLVVFDLFMRQGANWARIVLIALTVLSLGSITHTHGLGTLFAAISVTAAVLTVLRPSSTYFRATSAQLGTEPHSAPGP